MYTVNDWKKNIYTWIDVVLMLNAYCDCLGIYIYINMYGCRQDDNCRLCLYGMWMWTCDCRLDWVYVILKYGCVLVNWGVLWLYSLIDWCIDMLLADIGLKWDRLTIRVLSERIICWSSWTVLWMSVKMFRMDWGENC